MLMKNHPLYLAAFVVLTASKPATALVKKMTFKKAIEANLVSAKALSRGGHQGFCMDLTLRNLSPDSLEVTVEPGLKLNSEKDDLQDILVTREAIFVMAKGREQKQSVYGFCCQAHNRSPIDGAKYNLKSKPDDNLQKLAVYLSKSKFDDQVVQQSIWAISDSNQTAGIGGGGCIDTNLFKLRTLVSRLKGEPVPDYLLVQKVVQLANGRMYTVNIALKGTLAFQNPNYQYCYLKVFDANNQQVSVEIGQWLSSTASGQYNFDVPAQQLAKGEYTLKLVGDNRVLGEKKVKV